MKSSLDFVKKFYNQNYSLRNNSNLYFINIIGSWKYLFLNRKLMEISQPSNILDDTLFISITPMAFMEVLNEKNNLINRINCFFGKIVIKNIVFISSFNT